MIFVNQFVLLFILFSPVHLHEYHVLHADFNKGETVYKSVFPLTRVGPNTYKLTSVEGEKTFCISKIRTMIESYVEFETCDSHPTVRCVFETQFVARALFSQLNEEVPEKDEFPLLSITQVYGNDAEQAATSIHMDKIIGGTINVEWLDRFVVVSGRREPELVFSCGSFNVSALLLRGNVAVITRVRDIRYNRDVILNFLIKFQDAATAERFHEYITQLSSCIDTTIPLGNFAKV